MQSYQCTYGKLVESEDGKVGMIIGITNNVPNADLAERSKVENAI